MANITIIKALAEKLLLSHLAKEATNLNDEKPENLDFLEMILRTEVESREATNAERRMMKAKLPVQMYLKEMANSGLAWQITELETLKWLQEEQNLVLVGKCNTGKTSLAAHLGKLAIEEGMRIFYCTAEELLLTAKRKERSEKYKRQFAYMTGCSLIIIDDMMYTGISAEDLGLLYHATMFLNESRSLIIITNRELSMWKEATEDRHLVETYIDRITGNSQIIWM